MTQHIYNKITAVLRSQKIFYIVVGLLVVQSVWIALTARYPQAFDENYHLGLIQLHAKQLFPYFTSQPPDSSVFGAIVRDPSYLFHYLLSFPYNLIVSLTDNTTVQIIVLRFINVAIFVWGLFVYRKLFDTLGVSTVLRNVVLLFFVLTPVVPLLAGQINYDNLMFVLTGMLFLYAVRYVHLLEFQNLNSSVVKSTHTPAIPYILLLQIVFVAAFGSLVKFPFLPLALAVVCIVGYITYRFVRKTKISPSKLFVVTRRKLTIFMLIMTILVGILGIERYGINLVKYHDPVPSCDAVLTIKECMLYSPWARDYMYAASFPKPTVQGIVVYPVVWKTQKVMKQIGWIADDCAKYR